MPENIRALIELEALGSTRLGFPTNVAKAARILETGDTTLVSGPKVTEFFRSLCLVPGAVCVDRHMLMWGGCGHSWTKRNVAHVRSQVLEYAKERGLASFEAQAEIWSTLATSRSLGNPADIVAEMTWRVRP